MDGDANDAMWFLMAPKPGDIWKLRIRGFISRVAKFLPAQKRKLQMRRQERKRRRVNPFSIQPHQARQMSSTLTVTKNGRKFESGGRYSKGSLAEDWIELPSISAEEVAAQIAARRKHA